MALTLQDKWVWDCWLTRNGDDHHVFYLQAPRSLEDPDLRHRHATIGHAVSTDLRNWQVLPDALHPGDPGAWDDVATWTGSVIRHDSVWYMFYTGTCHAEEGRIQRIGLATSTDLVHWEKHGPDPLIQADDRWYEKYETLEWKEEAWRDPWVYEADGTFHALITARSPDGPTDGRGVIGHATSTDLLTWTVHPPLSESGEFGHLEVPQLVSMDDQWLGVFSCDGASVSDRRRDRVGQVGDAVYVVPVPGPVGPFDVRAAIPALTGGLYSGRLTLDDEAGWVWIAFLDDAGDGSFAGELSDPLPFQMPASPDVPRHQGVPR